MRALPDGRIQWITPTGHRYHSHPYDYRSDDDPPPPTEGKTARELPKALTAELDRCERNRMTTDWWNGETTSRTTPRRVRVPAPAQVTTDRRCRKFRFRSFSRRNSLPSNKWHDSFETS